MGLAVLDKLTIGKELTTGLLVLLSPSEPESENGYWLETAPGKENLPRIAYSHDWLETEINRFWVQETFVGRNCAEEAS